MIMSFEKKVKDYIENFSDEMLVTVIDAKSGITVASQEAKQFKEKAYFDDYAVKYFINYDKNVVVLGVVPNGQNYTDNSKQIS